jgi:hypothetical protein
LEFQRARVLPNYVYATLSSIINFGGSWFTIYSEN